MDTTNDIIGRRFGKLVVVKYEKAIRIRNRRGTQKFYLCQCDCGKTKLVAREYLFRGSAKSCGCLRKPTDRSGLRIGKLVLLKMVSCEKHRHPKYLCRCDCGRETVTQWSNLQSGHTKSCGCEKRVTGQDNKCWTGYGGINGRFWSRIKNNANRKTKTLPFEITIEYAWNLFQKQSGKCALTGLPIEMPKNSKKDFSHTASLDRINSNIGYLAGNVQWVHKIINRMKTDLPLERFGEMCRLVAEHIDDKR